MFKFTNLLSFALLAVVACGGKNNNTEMSTPTNREHAKYLAQTLIMVDGHVDIPYRLKRKPADISVQTEDGHFDYVRAKIGGLNAPFMSIYIPSDRENNGAKALADTLINLVESIAADHPDKFAVATSPDEIEQQFAKGLISLPMGMENGAPIEGDLDNVDYFYDRGIRYITLTHAKDNHICDSSYDTTRTWNGLSEFGVQLVEKMNDTGIIIDVSHISDSTFYQVMELSKVPVFASHSSCRHFTPGFERNMSDDMIKTLAAHDGVVHINYGSSFLDADFRAAEKGDTTAFTTVQMVADHIDHVVDIAGIDYVGLGSDFDGVSSLPRGLEDASEMPNLLEELLQRGYSDEDIAKICYQNTFRVWNTVEAYAAKQKEGK
jgi:membrane dipeptidase